MGVSQIEESTSRRVKERIYEFIYVSSRVEKISVFIKKINVKCILELKFC